jgi:hypothetical protein
MAYVVVQPRSDGLSLSLEGRPLCHGDALWVPVNAEAGDVVRDWLAAVFVEADARGETITVTLEDRARDPASMSVPIQVGVRRRDQRGPGVVTATQ